MINGQLSDQWYSRDFFVGVYFFRFVFFLNDTATTEIYTLALHDALPISGEAVAGGQAAARHRVGETRGFGGAVDLPLSAVGGDRDRALCDREVGADERQVVVIAAVAIADGQRPERDRIGADVGAGRARGGAGGGR